MKYAFKCFCHVVVASHTDSPFHCTVSYYMGNEQADDFHRRSARTISCTTQKDPGRRTRPPANRLNRTVRMVTIRRLRPYQSRRFNLSICSSLGNRQPNQRSRIPNSGADNHGKRWDSDSECRGLFHMLSSSPSLLVRLEGRRVRPS